MSSSTISSPQKLYASGVFTVISPVVLIALVAMNRLSSARIGSGPWVYGIVRRAQPTRTYVR